MSPRVDDPSIADEVALYRRVHPDFLVPDENRGCIRLSKGAFQNDEMSIDLGDDLESQHVEPAELLDGYAGYALVSLPAAVARALNQIVCRDHSPPNTTTHGLVIGRKRGGVQKALARAAEWIVPPPGACHPPSD